VRQNKLECSSLTRFSS